MRIDCGVLSEDETFPDIVVGIWSILIPYRPQESCRVLYPTALNSKSQALNPRH